MGKKKSAKKDREVPKVNKDLDGFDIQINSFGEIVTSYDLDKINDFLDKNVDDKKLKSHGEVIHTKKIQKEVEQVEDSEKKEESF